MQYEFPKLNARPALVFLDGCHDYEVVIEEAKYFLTALCTHGIILIHDTLPKKEEHLRRGACSTAYKARQEIEAWAPELIDCFTWPFTAGRHGLTMIVKKEEDRPYFRR
jgi:hypothetical protein